MPQLYAHITIIKRVSTSIITTITNTSGIYEAILCVRSPAYPSQDLELRPSCVTYYSSSPLFSYFYGLITLLSPFCRSPEYEASTANMAFAVPAAADALVKKVWYEKNIHKKYDEKNLLQKALKRSKTNSSYWGGKDYVKQTAYTSLDSLTKGFIDASSIYCPSLVPSKISTTHHTFSSNHSENASVNSQDAAEKEVRTYSVHSVLTHLPTL
jgi:hypothetical protein